MDLSSDSDSLDDIIEAINKNLKKSSSLEETDQSQECSTPKVENSESNSLSKLITPNSNPQLKRNSIDIMTEGVDEDSNVLSQDLNETVIYKSPKKIKLDKTSPLKQKNPNNSSLTGSKKNKKHAVQDRTDLVNLYITYSKLVHTIKQLGWFDIMPYIMNRTMRHIPCYWPIRIMNQDEINVSPLCTNRWSDITSGSYLAVELLGRQVSAPNSQYIIRIEEFIGWNDPQVVKEQFKKGGLKKSPYIDSSKKTKYLKQKNWISFENGVKIGNYLEKRFTPPTPTKNPYGKTYQNTRRLNYSERKRESMNRELIKDFKETEEEELEAGDTITFFYKPLNKTCTTKVFQISPNDFQPIHLVNNYTIDDTFCIKRLSDKHGNPVVIDYNTGIGCSKPLSHFKLIESSMTQLDPSATDRIGALKKYIDALRNELNESNNNNNNNELSSPEA